MKPISTILCVPGHDERKVARARDFGADIILWDLEDSVPSDRKGRARELVALHARDRDHVRVSSAGPHGVPLADARMLGLGGFTYWLPKLSNPVAAQRVAVGLGVPVVVLVEHPLAVLLLHRLVGLSHPGSPWLAGLAFGAADFCASAGVERDSPLVDHARAQVVLGAKAMGVPCYDSPCEDRDGARARMEALIARKLGFTGKGCIFPHHVEIVSEAFDSPPGEAAEALAIVEEAGLRHAELFTRNGRVVGPPHVRRAEEVLRAGRE